MDFKFAILVAWVVLVGLSARSATNTASSVSYSDVASAVSASTYGDTVRIPAGEATWTNLLTVTKGMRLLGAGTNQTIIHSSQTTCIEFNPDGNTVTNDYRFELAGFTFDGDGSGNSGGFVQLDNDWTAGGDQNHTNTVIRNCEFVDVSGRSIYISGHCWGVAYSCVFRGPGTMLVSYGNEANSWNNSTFTAGTADNFYVEDCVLADTTYACAGGHGGRWAFRYNYWTNGTDFGMQEMHGNQPGDIYAGMGIELYGNVFVMSRNQDFMALRGGKAMIFNNLVTNSASPTSFRLREEYADSISPTTNGTQHVNNAYFWNNWLNGAELPATIAEDCCAVLVENVTFWNYDSTFDGSTGIGAGSSLPVGVPTDGVGYWVTSHSPAGQPPGTIDDLKTYSQSGRFYVASSGSFVQFYQPLQYPHPLRTENRRFNIITATARSATVGRIQ